MKNLHKSVLLWHSADEMFALVTDVARYPEFLPWCSSARVLETLPDGMTAEIGMKVAGLSQALHPPGHWQRARLQGRAGAALRFFQRRTGGRGGAGV